MRRVTIAAHLLYAGVVLLIAATLAVATKVALPSYASPVLGSLLPGALGFAAHGALILMALFISTRSGARAHLFVVDVMYVVVTGIFGVGLLAVVGLNPEAVASLAILGYALSLICGGLVAAAPRREPATASK